MSDPLETLTDRVRTEVETMHSFLEQWLNGSLPKSRESFEREFIDCVDADFVNIQPAGIALSGKTLIDAIFEGHGASPDFRIRVRNVAIRRTFDNDNVVLATYEEYQRGARNSALAENARVSTALMLDRGNAHRFRWIHIHETWLPEENHAPENFNF